MTTIAFPPWILLAQDGAAKAPEAAPATGLPFPVLMAIILVFAYLLLFRPEQKKRRDFQAMVEKLKEKDRVVTVGGIHGVVTGVQRDSGVVTIRVDEATGTKIRVAASAIAKIVVDEEKADQ